MRRRVLRSLRPGDLRVIAGTVWWIAVLPLLKRALPLPTLVRLMWHPGRVESRSRETERTIVPLVGGLCRIGRGNCLTRSLILYRILARQKASPRLVMGLRRNEGVEGHAWVTVDGQALLEEATGPQGYEEVVVFAENGLQEPLLGPA